MQILIDATTNKVIPSPSHKAGTFGQISFARLARTLSACGETEGNAEISHFIIDTEQCMLLYRYAEKGPKS